MKAFFTIILLMLASAGFCQREYTHENKGINIFLEADGNGNRDIGLGGPAFTIGYQFNPYFFLGCGLSNKYGTERDKYYDEIITLGWYDASTDTYHSDYYIDEKGERHKIYNIEDGDLNYNVELVDDCGECEGLDAVLDVYVDVRYDLLANTRYTPYVNFRTGCTFGSLDRASFEELLLGCRFGCGEGDFAIVGGAGWTYRYIKDDELKSQHLFTLRLGVEF